MGRKTYSRQRGGRASSQLTALVIATYGDQCWLRLPGCKGRATTKDHVTPVAQGGTNDLSNLRPACGPCNSKRQNKNVGAHIKVITGPPASGKNVYVREHAGPLDVVIDLDRIALAFMHPDTEPTHDYPRYIKHIAIGARSTAIQRATTLYEQVTVWLIHAVPSPDQLAEYHRLRYDVIELDPGEDVVRQRIHDQRPTASMDAADRWYGTKQTAAAIAPPSREW